MEATKAMLHNQEMPMFLWEEAARTTICVQNRCPHQILEYNIPEEVFTSERPNVKHLRILGFHAYVHLPKKKRIKLEPSK